MRNLGVADLQTSETKAESSQKSVNATSISSTVSKFAPENATQLNEQKKQISSFMATGKRESQKAEALRREADTLRASSQKLMNQHRYGNTAYDQSQVQSALWQEHEASGKMQHRQNDDCPVYGKSVLFIGYH